MLNVLEFCRLKRARMLRKLEGASAAAFCDRDVLIAYWGIIRQARDLMKIVVAVGARGQGVATHIPGDIEPPPGKRPGPSQDKILLNYVTKTQYK